MKNSVAQYLFAAMAADAAFVACDMPDGYQSLLMFARCAVSAERIANLCEGEDECSKNTIQKIKKFLNRNKFGIDEWYRNALQSALAGKKIVLDEHELSCKKDFDREFKETYRLEPPNLGEQ